MSAVIQVMEIALWAYGLTCHPQVRHHPPSETLIVTVVTLCPGTFAAVFGGVCCLFWRHLHPGIPCLGDRAPITLATLWGVSTSPKKEWEIQLSITAPPCLENVPELMHILLKQINITFLQLGLRKYPPLSLGRCPNIWALGGVSCFNWSDS